MEITVTKNEFRNLVVSELKDYLEAKMSSEETKVLQFLIKHGANPKEAEKDVKKHFKNAKRIWRGSTKTITIEKRVRWLSTMLRR